VNGQEIVREPSPFKMQVAILPDEKGIKSKQMKGMALKDSSATKHPTDCASLGTISAPGFSIPVPAQASR
jgi:hypothetical protein